MLFYILYLSAYALNVAFTAIIGGNYTGTTSAKIVLNQAGSANGQAYYLVSRNDGNFVIGNASNGIADQFILDSLGNVGIRTKSTTHSLEVLGSGYGRFSCFET